MEEGKGYEQAGLVERAAISSAQSLWSRRAQTPKSSHLSCLSLWVSIAVPYLETTHCNMLRGCWGGVSHLPLLLPKTQNFAERTEAPLLGLEGVSLLLCPSP